MGFYNESSPPPQRRPGLLGPAPPGVMSMQQQQQQPNAGVRGMSEHNDVDLRQMQGPPSKFPVHMLALKYILLFGFSFIHYCIN